MAIVLRLELEKTLLSMTQKLKAKTKKFNICDYIKIYDFLKAQINFEDSEELI
jgi:hypothetical protein